MKVIRTNPLNTITWHEETKIMEFERFVTYDLDDDMYKTEALTILKLAEDYRPLGILTDNRNFNYTIVPDLQHWIATTILPRYLSIGVQKGALVVSSDFFTQVSIQQTLEEDIATKFQIRYFDNREEAYTWLIT